MKAYKQLLNNKLNNILSEISNIELDLRCCGNCIQFNTKCNLGKQDGFARPTVFSYCSQWEYDGLTNKERIIK